ncbi:6022_t:CDS:2, partial [Cetraspora pellucida]
LSPANQIEVQCMKIEKLVDKLLPKLEEIKKFIAEQLSEAYLNLIKSMTASAQTQPISLQL